MATALDLLNNVLRGLRRDVVQSTSTTDAYHLLLIQWLNLAKDAIEAEWDWEALRTTVTVTLSASTQTYTLSEVGPADTDVSDKARLLYERGVRYSRNYEETSERYTEGLPQVFDTTDSAEYRLREISWEQFERIRSIDADDTASRPEYFALRRTGTYQELGVWPMPSGTRTLTMRFVIPQAVIPYSFMTAYSISIPDTPVWTAALVKALEDRGENTGRPLEAVQKDAMDALAIAKAREQSTFYDTLNPV